MTLKSKFQILFNNTTVNKNRVDESVQIADEFAIGFAEWVECSKTYYTPMIDLLEIYKREKDL